MYKNIEEKKENIDEKKSLIVLLTLLLFLW